MASWKYDVFINFRGEDTRRGFVAHLYRALRQKLINTFIDAEDLRKGDRLSEVLTAIRESRLSIVVFSQNYACSSWCLKELVEILECEEAKGQIVLPIFYEVDPSNIRKLEGSFAEAFARHKFRSDVDVREVESWSSTLARAAEICGWDTQNFRDDVRLIEEIVGVVFGKLTGIVLTSSKDNGLECTGKPEVFLSFRGEDTRRRFVGHLYKALHDRKINTFFDEEQLRKGDHLSKLLTAILESTLSLVVFSGNYASSTWCMKELAVILECMDTKNQIVLPVFYEVDPSNIRNLEGSFAEAFAKHERNSNVHLKVVQSWRSALARASYLSGWHSQNYEDDAELIAKIVEDVSRKLIHISSTSSKDNGFNCLSEYVSRERNCEDIDMPIPVPNLLAPLVLL